MQPMHVPAGATIFRAGDPSSAVYVIEDGEVAITVNGITEVARLHPGELFGESGVLEARARAATATAITATTLLVTEAETFFRAFGMNNDRALALVKLLCARLRSTTLRSASTFPGGIEPDAPTLGHASIRILPDSERLVSEYIMTPVDVRQLPFQVGNRYGGEILPITSNHTCCIPARGTTDLAAPHFEILRRDGHLGVRDLGTINGTVVNGTLISRMSMNAFVPLRPGDNEVIAGRPDSPFRFRIQFNAA
jgi:CRP/FNR family cyclic AMP-dependent transcriptional regulator